MKILIVYDSRTGNSEKMAYAVEDGVKRIGVESILKKIDEASVDELLNVQGVILGSPVYYGLPSAKIKDFLDASVKHHGKLNGLVGGAFTSSGGAHTGGETTIISILEALLIHGMIIQGTSGKNHYGPVSIGEPDDKILEVCRDFGERMAKLVTRLNGKSLF